MDDSGDGESQQFGAGPRQRLEIHWQGAFYPNIQRMGSKKRA